MSALDKASDGLDPSVALTD